MFIIYLRHQLLLQGKPIIKFNPSSILLYCSKGVFQIESDNLGEEFIMAEDDEWVRSLTLLMDANYVNTPVQPRYIPIVNAARDGYIAPRVVYTTSPQLRSVKNALISNLSGRYLIRVMNPWTPFEIEIM